MTIVMIIYRRLLIKSEWEAMLHLPPPRAHDRQLRWVHKYSAEKGASFPSCICLQIPSLELLNCWKIRIQFQSVPEAILLGSEVWHALTRRVPWNKCPLRCLTHSSALGSMHFIYAEPSKYILLHLKFSINLKCTLFQSTQQHFWGRK